MKLTHCVNKIKAGEKYQVGLCTVEGAVSEADKRTGFWAELFRDELFPTYKAAEDRWSLNYFIGSTDFIEEHNPYVKFIDNQWYLRPKLKVHHLDKDVSVMYFDSDNEMIGYVNTNFPGFRGLDDNKKQKIKIG